MDEIERLARDGAAEGIVVVADHQERGRGRSGRSWTAEPGAALLCSILLRPGVRPDRLGPLPLVVGVAVAEAIEETASLPCHLKWPNDVIIQDRKVAGILIQSRLSGTRVEHVNVGIGVNLGEETNLPEGATSLAGHGVQVGRDALLHRLLRRLDERYRAFLDGNRALQNTIRTQCAADTWSVEWRRRAIFVGERVAVVSDGETLEGRFQDIDPMGRLLLETGAGELLALSTGDIEQGPRPI